MKKSAPFLILGIVGVGGAVWLLTLPKPTPEERRAMAIAEAHMRAHGLWKPGTTLRVSPRVPKKLVTLHGIDIWSHTSWAVTAEYPRNATGRGYTYDLDKNFKVIKIYPHK